MSELQDPEIFRIVLDSLQTGVYLVDRERKIVFWNDGAERVTGYRRHDVVGRSCRDNILMQCNDRGCVLCGAICPFTQTMQDGKPREARIELRHKEGHQIPVRMRIVPIRNAHGSLIGVAESFDEQRFATDRDRRQHNLAAYGCLDETTGIPNHSFTRFHLRENLESFAEYHLPFGILLIQADELQHFKAAYSREAGDAILRVVALTMKNNLRPSDFLGRWADDQFLAILMNCTVGGVSKAAERMKKLAVCAGLQWWGDQLSVNTSIGLAAAETGDSIESLLERAQRSLEHASAKLAATASSAAGLSSPKS
jgi:diguanylate cyclase (GGDEF)-like protein/PAS domain S-box-containing protein